MITVSLRTGVNNKVLPATVFIKEVFEQMAVYSRPISTLSRFTAGGNTSPIFSKNLI
jgi:hypothetical protein